MTWDDEVHSNRYNAAVARASAERRLRRRGLPVSVMGTAKAGPVLAMVALASGLVAWQQWGPLAGRVLARNPLVQQLRALVFGPGSPAAGRAVASKISGKGGTTISSSSKASARKPTLAAAAVAPTPAAAAAAAAEARIMAQSSSAPGTSVSGTAAGSGGSKKKKSGKRRH
ncbi:hypothetical protein TSOC_009441 [Tetrabaena socialis]|uniref:Uncharacterized protein n=1 Tax=Tetrabaena socialis TaxID=47790 RepID=A0A2J7ZVW2_9CHLO|nr:hypothetical protein TSOC_009441 [Tetrabaena socialis]|eukprot:PNH04399.1 hypothetical protein TSOC_009441 [Tetrabaena socialis]